MFCNNCGHRNPPDANFCSSCGAALARSGETETTVTFSPVEALAEADEEISVVVPDVQEESGVLIVKRGPNVGSRFGLQTAITQIGRHPDSDIFLDDITVSRRHAEIALLDDHSFQVRDVGSLNGTYLNRERIEAATLKNGDEVQVGRFKLVFLSGSAGT